MARKIVVYLGTAALFVALACAVILPLTLGDHNTGDGGSRQEVRGSSVLYDVPLVDGHNDLPHNLYKLLGNRLDKFKFDSNLLLDEVWGPYATSHTDLPRLREGRVGGQFWVAYVPCSTQHRDAVERTMAQIDVIKRLIKAYPNDLQYATTADDIVEAHKNQKIASLIVVEGGHSIDDRLSVLRLYYELGVRYMTLTHSCNQPWIDASPIDSDNEAIKRNLTPWGVNVIKEMNRLGMMVDLSHVSYGVMHAVLDVTTAPVMFSHSSSYTVYPHHRNVQDDVLLRVRDNNGVVMVNFYSLFIAGADATIYDAMKHINHIRDVAGVDHVGIGGDYDGVDKTPVGLEDVSKYPQLFDLLASPDEKYNTFTPWTLEELKKLAGENILRVMRAVEKRAAELAKEAPIDELIPEEDVYQVNKEQFCKTDFNYVPDEDDLPVELA